MAPPDEKKIGLGDEILDQVDLGGNLGPSEDHGHRPFGVFQDLPQITHFLFQLIAGGTYGNKPRDPVDRRMGTMGNGEGVIYINFGQRCQPAGKLRIVLLLFRMKTEVFQAGGFARVSTPPPPFGLPRPHNPMPWQRVV